MAFVGVDSLSVQLSSWLRILGYVIVLDSLEIKTNISFVSLGERLRLLNYISKQFVCFLDLMSLDKNLLSLIVRHGSEHEHFLVDGDGLVLLPKSLHPVGLSFILLDPSHDLVHVFVTRFFGLLRFFIHVHQRLLRVNSLILHPT